MKIFYDKYKRPSPPKVYLGTPNNKIICAIDGINENSFDLKANLQESYTLSFEINKYLTYQVPTSTMLTDGNDEPCVGGDIVTEYNASITDSDHTHVGYPTYEDHLKTKRILSNSYVLAGILMRIYVENIGWFLMQPPEEQDDGNRTYKTINAVSVEMELQQHDLKNFKINQGTTDSYEMLADNNVEKIGDVEFAKEQIKFYNSSNHQLSLIDLAIKVAGATGWTIGYIDEVPEMYRNYEDGKYVETQTLLRDEIGTFDVESENLYTFLSQDVAKYFNCICVFDIRNLTINFYHPDNLGKDTGINLSFRNLKKSHDITVDEDSIFTRYYVSGEDDLGIAYVNFGDNYIEDLSYFMNEKYMNKSLIQKYSLWSADVETQRLKYIEITKNLNKQISVISELYDRQPIDDCSTDWSTFSDEDLIEAKANYEAQQKGYEQFYVDEDGNFDEEALKNSVDADTYYQIRDVIIPSIIIEFENRELPTDADKKEYIDTYKTNWKLYGLDELQVKLNGYQDIIKTCKAGGYDQPYSDKSTKTKEVHDEMYAKYQDALNNLNSSYSEGCQEAYDQRKSEIDTATALRDEYQKTRDEIVKTVDKNTWTNGSYSFTDEDLEELSKLYIDGDYTNDNMFLTSSDNQVSAIDEQLKLLKAAQDDLYIMSRPQYKYTTSLENFIAKYEYKNYTNNLNLGDYIHLEVDDNYVIKLRVISFSCNPLIMDNNLTIEFSDMIQSRNKRSDLSFLLDNASGGSKNSASGSSDNFLNNEGITLTAGLIQKLLSTGAFSNKVTQIVNNTFAGVINGTSISLDELNAKMIKATDIIGENGFFNYLSAKLIEADKIVADSGNFKELNALVATIKQAIIGASSTETGIVINLTAENATMSEALIKSLIAQYISVGDLKAGSIDTDKFKVISEDGKLQIVGNTFTIYNAKGQPVIQLGQDKNGNYGLVISDDNGAVLLDSQGLHEGIVPDNFIKTDMIGDGQVTENKIDKTNIRNWVDAEGNKVFDVSKMYYGDDMFLTSYTTVTSSVKKSQKDINDLKDTVAGLGNGYTVVLSNETQNIPCTSEGITSTSFLIEIPFKGYEGIKQSPCTVEISGLPTGITLGSNKPSTTTEDGLVVLSVQKDSDLGGNSILTGTITFTCTVAGKTIVKKFTWIKSLAGKQGSQGVPGTSAKQYYTWVKYADTPTTGMSDEPEGKNYIGLAYNKESQTESTNYSDYEWSLIKGKDGESIAIVSKEVAYLSTDDGVNIPEPHLVVDEDGNYITDESTNRIVDNKWQVGSIPSVLEGQYLWTRTTVNYSDGNSTVSYSVSRQGIDGTNGTDGINGKDGKDGTSEYVHIKYSAYPSPTDDQITETPSDYIGICVNQTIEDPDTADSYTWSKFKGTDGEEGIPGKNGYVHFAYATSANGKESFSKSEFTGATYIGVYSDNTIEDSGNYQDYAWSLIKGDKGDKGDDGDSLYTWIKYADDASGNNMSDDSTGKDYIGLAYNKVTATKSTNPKDYTWSLFRGAQGVQGEKGADGKVYYTWFKYADDAKGTNMSKDPTGKKYIGLAYNKETQAESNVASDYTWSLFRGADGVKGDKGDTGATLYTWLKYSDDPNGKNMTDNPDGKKYIGIAYNKNTSTESTNPSDYTWSLIQGADGNDAVLYSLKSSVDVIKKETVVNQYITDESGNRIVDENGQILYEITYGDDLSPASVTFYSYMTVGNSDPIDYPCRFIIMESQNGASYATKYTSSKDETSVSYTPSTSDLHHIKCILCAAGGITTQLDSQTVMVLEDASALPSAVKTFSEKFTSVDFRIDNNEKIISQKVEQKDIDNTINDYDGTTIKKIREVQAEHTVSIGTITSKVSDVESEMTTKADGSTVTELTTKVSKLEQDADGFKQTVEKNYATNDSVVNSISSAVNQSAENIKSEVAKTYGTKTEITAVDQKANSIAARVTTNEGDITQLKADQKGITSTVENLKVGTENLIRSSNNLIFNAYIVVAMLLDETGNRIIDEKNNQLSAYY